jgi:hypothetical protein
MISFSIAEGTASRAGHGHQKLTGLTSSPLIDRPRARYTRIMGKPVKPVKPPKRRKPQAAAPTPDAEVPTLDKWYQPWSEPVRPLTGEDVAKIRRDERQQVRTDQAEQARAGKARAASNKNQALRDAIAAEMTGPPSQHPYKDAEAILGGVNARLKKQGFPSVSVDTIARRLKPQSSRARKR